MHPEREGYSSFDSRHQIRRKYATRVRADPCQKDSSTAWMNLTPSTPFETPVTSELDRTKYTSSGLVLVEASMRPSGVTLLILIA